MVECRAVSIAEPDRVVVDVGQSVAALRDQAFEVRVAEVDLFSVGDRDAGSVIGYGRLRGGDCLSYDLGASAQECRGGLVGARTRWLRRIVREGRCFER